MTETEKPEDVLIDIVANIKEGNFEAAKEKIEKSNLLPGQKNVIFYLIHGSNFCPINHSVEEAGGITDITVALAGKIAL